MWVSVAILGFALVVVALSWWIRRHQAKIDGYDDEHEKREEYRDPPVFQGPDGPT